VSNDVVPNDEELLTHWIKRPSCATFPWQDTDALPLTLLPRLSLGLAIAWAGLLVYDILIFLFTLIKALKEPSLGKSAIMQLLLRDGRSSASYRLTKFEHN
jgi:hypothetical protein